MIEHPATEHAGLDRGGGEGRAIRIGDRHVAHTRHQHAIHIGDQDLPAE